MVATSLAYAVGVTASEALGSRLASFVGLLEVAFAALFAWLLLDEKLGALQILGGVFILAGIAAVRAEKSEVPPPQPLVTDISGEPASAVRTQY